ncbi:hypothetical protein [Pseudooceanicola atlanticus]|uniref:hypothetical protein n=1 Tax=Pseudooceanicola atlanticus TaxID=1461694 RepID=UPI0023546CBD|nr:hypothetical protein [Pseudooceanicola atlanticus]
MPNFVLTSSKIPARAEVFDPIENSDGLNKVSPDYPHKITEVAEAVSIAGVSVTEKTRYIALLTGGPAGYKIVTEGLIGTVCFTQGPWEMEVYAPDGTVVYSGDAEDCPNVLQPEMFGLKSYVWWQEAKR